MVQGVVHWLLSTTQPPVPIMAFHGMTSEKGLSTVYNLNNDGSFPVSSSHIYLTVLCNYWSGHYLPTFVKLPPAPTATIISEPRMQAGNSHSTLYVPQVSTDVDTLTIPPLPPTTLSGAGLATPVIQEWTNSREFKWVQNIAKMFFEKASWTHDHFMFNDSIPWPNMIQNYVNGGQPGYHGTVHFLNKLSKCINHVCLLKLSQNLFKLFNCDFSVGQQAHYDKHIFGYFWNFLSELCFVIIFNNFANKILEYFLIISITLEFIAKDLWKL